MIKYLILLSVLFLSCGGEAGRDGTNGKDGKDGTNGYNGFDGKNGKDGLDGYTTISDKVLSIYKNSRSSVYRITVLCNNKAVSFGSGFRVKDNEVATNFHVVSNGCEDWNTKYKINTLYSSLDTIAGSTFYSDGDCPSGSEGFCITVNKNNYTVIGHSRYDLAKIRIPRAFPGKPLSIEKGIFHKTGKAVVNMSFPLGMEDLFFTIGAISSNYTGDCHGTTSAGCPALDYDINLDLNADHGSSGSPIFDLDTGKVIGVLTAGLSGNNLDLIYAIYASRLEDFGFDE